MVRMVAVAMAHSLAVLTGMIDSLIRKYGKPCGL